jgi:tetratricopeptide (TPR) repeat protein
MNHSRAALALACALAAASPALGDAVKAPDASQKASVAQTIGVTDVAVSYHRPLVNKREVWGKLVPYDLPWRAGANENTTITFSTPVTIEGTPRAAGTYGLHMIPGKETWTVALSKNSTSWGSYSYDQKEDALRVTVKPHESSFREALTYEFDDVKSDSAVLELQWEKLAVPLKIGADTKALTMESFRNQLRTVPGFSWEGYQTAADWAADNDQDLEQATKWVDQSIQQEARFENWQTKSKILKKQGKTAEADKAMATAVSLATPLQRHFYARQLLGQKKVDEALAIFKSNAEKNPNFWVARAGLARGYVAKGDYASALKALKEALPLAPDANSKSQLETLIKRVEAKQDINS